MLVKELECVCVCVCLFSHSHMVSLCDSEVTLAVRSGACHREKGGGKMMFNACLTRPDGKRTHED